MKSLKQMAEVKLTESDNVGAMVNMPPQYDMGLTNNI